MKLAGVVLGSRCREASCVGSEGLRGSASLHSPFPAAGPLALGTSLVWESQGLCSQRSCAQSKVSYV